MKLTGLTSHNIRVWEKRHQAVVAKRLPSGRRFYTQAQVNRLLLLKQCIDCGSSISDLAKLSDVELEEKLKTAVPRKIQRIKKDHKITVGVLGKLEIAEQLEKMANLTLILKEEVTDFSNIHLHRLLSEERPNVLILEVSTIQEANAKSITELIKRNNPLLSVIIYRYGNQTNLNGLRNQGARLLRAPIDQESLINLVSGYMSNIDALNHLVDLPSVQQYPVHIYTSHQLSKITKITTKVDCECPNHLVEILTGLKEFEKYSGECINKNDEDAALHAEIQLKTALARQQLECLLEKVLDVEGISI